MRSRGYTLIELMVTVAMIGLAAVMILGNLRPYQEQSTRAFETAGLARVLDVEMERMRACDTRACLDELVTAPAFDVADTWVRAKVVRKISPGPDGTVRVRLEATAPSRRGTASIEALLWVKP